MLNSDNSFYSYMDGTLSWLDAFGFITSIVIITMEIIEYW